MIKLLKNYQVKSYDMMLDRMVTMNYNSLGIARNIPPTIDATSKYINTLTRRLNQRV